MADLTVGQLKEELSVYSDEAVVKFEVTGVNIRVLKATVAPDNKAEEVQDIAVPEEKTVEDELAD